MIELSRHTYKYTPTHEYTYAHSHSSMSTKYISVSRRRRYCCFCFENCIFLKCSKSWFTVWQTHTHNTQIHRDCWFCFFSLSLSNCMILRFINENQIRCVQISFIRCYCWCCFSRYCYYSTSARFSLFEILRISMQYDSITVYYIRVIQFRFQMICNLLMKIKAILCSFILWIF